MNSSKFVFVTPAYNSETTIAQSIFSVLAQSYDDWRMIVYDDMSTDNTAQVVEDMSKSLCLGSKLSVVSRKEKYGEVHNTLDAVKNIDDKEIICRLDGGDWLTENDTLAILNNIYQTQNSAVVWTMQRWAYSNYNISGPLQTSDADVYTHPWVSSHLKTFRKDAINNINKKNFKDAEGNWIMIGCDQAVFLPIMHKALTDGKDRTFLPLVCYHYNINLDDPELFTCERSKNQKYSAEWIRQRGYIN